MHTNYTPDFIHKTQKILDLKNFQTKKVSLILSQISFILKHRKTTIERKGNGGFVFVFIHS